MLTVIFTVVYPTNLISFDITESIQLSVSTKLLVGGVIERITG